MNLSTFRKIASLSIVVALIGAVGLFNPAQQLLPPATSQQRAMAQSALSLMQ
jgi:hypothetical protein